MPQLTAYTFPYTAPEYLVRGVTQTIRMGARDEAGNVAIPASGTVTVYDQDHTAIVSGAHNFGVTE